MDTHSGRDVSSSLFSWVEFMAEEPPEKQKERRTKNEAAPLSLFEWPLTLEQDREEELASVGR